MGHASKSDPNPTGRTEASVVESHEFIASPLEKTGSPSTSASVETHEDGDMVALRDIVECERGKGSNRYRRAIALGTALSKRAMIF